MAKTNNSLRIPKELRQQAEAMVAEYNRPEAKAERTVTTAAAAEKKATRESRNSAFRGQSNRNYAIRELLQSGGDTTATDVDEKVMSRREPNLQWTTPDLAHFDLATSIHESINHAANNLFGMGGYDRASKEDSSDKIAQAVFGKLHKARLHLDAHWDAHTNNDPEAAHGHLNEATKLMKSAVADYSLHPKAESVLGKSNARIAPSQYSGESAMKMLDALPGTYADKIKKETGVTLGAPAKVTVEDEYPSGKQIGLFLGNDPKKKAKVPRKKTAKVAPAQPTEEELAQRKQDADDVLKEWVASTPDAPKRGSTPRTKSRQFDSVNKLEPEPTPKFEQPDTRNVTPTWREKVALTPLEKEHNNNVLNHRNAMRNYHLHMAVINMAQGISADEHLDKVAIDKRKYATDMGAKIARSGNKHKIIGNLLAKAAEHKSNADSWYNKAVQSGREMRAEQEGTGNV